MLHPIDPTFERALQQSIANLRELLRTTQTVSAKLERDRIRAVVEMFEDYDERGNAALVEAILEEIGDGEEREVEDG